jgi:hypothetical protein
MLKFISPGNIAHNSKDQKNYVLKTGKYEMFVKVEGNGSEICNDPPGPVFKFLLIHQPHTGESGAGCKTVCYWYGTVGETAEDNI